MYGIWIDNDWLREYPENKAILVFETKELAEKRAAKHFWYDDYQDVVENELAEVREIKCQIS